tara:strand:+ start:342 stop:734 length:393 start_codon:yes stop_codon:yes gene_type:complete
MVASRNQQNVIARHISGLGNGSMPAYFGGNELMQNISGNEFLNPVASRKNVGSHMAGVHGVDNLGFLGTGSQIGLGVGISLAMIYAGLDFPGARTVAKNAKKVWNRPIPVIQNTMLFAGVGYLLVAQLTA